MFPTGAPGVAILILRISLAASVVDARSHDPKSSFVPLILLASAIHSVVLGLGLLTHIVSMAASVFEYPACSRLDMPMTILLLCPALTPRLLPSFSHAR